MSASLVGSEMCIRDRFHSTGQELQRSFGECPNRRLQCQARQEGDGGGWRAQDARGERLRVETRL
eukprot:14654917-Alexandrium_andersonii.AAC.1